MQKITLEELKDCHKYAGVMLSPIPEESLSIGKFDNIPEELISAWKRFSGELIRYEKILLENGFEVL